MGEQIGTKLARAEELGADGDVEDSLRLLQEVEDLKKNKNVVEVCSLTIFSPKNPVIIQNTSSTFHLIIFIEIGKNLLIITQNSILHQKMGG